MKRWAILMMLLWVATWSALGSGAGTLRPASLPASATTKADERWENLREKEFFLIVPAGWRKLDMPGIVVYLNGDGIGAPAMDETGGPIQIGITIERYPNQKGKAVEGAKQNLEGFRKNPRLKPVDDGKVEEFKLADGTEAAYLRVESIKDGTRRSLQQKVFAKDPNSTGWVVIGWIVTGKDSQFIQKNPEYVAALRAHLSSIVFDAGKISDAGVRAAYQQAAQPLTQPATRTAPAKP